METNREAKALRSAARKVNWIAAACAFVAAVVALIAFIASVRDDVNVSDQYWIAAGFLGAALMLVVIGQLLQIRAALKDRNRKD